MLLTLALLSAIAPLAIDMYLPGLPELGDDLRTSPSTVQLTLTTFMLGLAAGQLLMWPLSDSLGRRRPLLVGTVLLTVAGIGCALAPSIEVLIGFRFIQGLTGGIGVVVARAVIAFVPETSPAERRHAFEARTTGRNMRVVLSNRRYLGYSLTFTVGFGAMFAYISASPLVIQDLMGFSPGVFSLLFALNAVGIGIAGNATALALGQVHQRAGSGSAVLGTSQFVSGRSSRRWWSYWCAPCCQRPPSRPRCTGMAARRPKSSP